MAKKLPSAVKQLEKEEIPNLVLRLVDSILTSTKGIDHDDNSAQEVKPLEGGFASHDVVECW